MGFYVSLGVDSLNIEALTRQINRTFFTIGKELSFRGRNITGCLPIMILTIRLENVVGRFVASVRVQVGRIILNISEKYILIRIVVLFLASVKCPGDGDFFRGGYRPTHLFEWFL